jgi:hypothetical protein
MNSQSHFELCKREADVVIGYVVLNLEKCTTIISKKSPVYGDQVNHCVGMIARLGKPEKGQKYLLNGCSQDKLLGLFNPYDKYGKTEEERRHNARKLLAIRYIGNRLKLDTTINMFVVKTWKEVNEFYNYAMATADELYSYEDVEVEEGNKRCRIAQIAVDEFFDLLRSISEFCIEDEKTKAAHDLIQISRKAKEVVVID